jgi:hypothetical protein
LKSSARNFKKGGRDMTHYYFQSATRIIALIIGLIFGIGARFLTSTPLAIAIGAATALLSSLILAILFYIEDRPYRILMQYLEEKPILRERAMMNFPTRKSISACLYVYCGGMYLCSIQKEGPFCCRIPKKCVSSIRLMNDIGHFRICFYDGLCYDLRCLEEDGLMQQWQTQGFPIVDIPYETKT